MPKNKVFNFIFLLVFLVSVFAVSAQTKRNKRAKPVAKTPVQTEKIDDAKPETAPEPVNSGKKNSRPASENPSDIIKKAENQKPPAFVYEFSQPAFVISHVIIEHDENGKGKIVFKKKDLDEEFSDPIALTAVTLDKLKTRFDALNFLDSTEDYQFDKDFSHLGNVKITMRKDGKSRTAAFNWTSNEDAKAVASEYRKLANQYIWMFDITVARENQPLETPRIMKALDSYIRRDEISDPPQMIPFLQDLSNDERVPLITRNNASKLIKEIEKKNKK